MNNEIIQLDNRIVFSLNGKDSIDFLQSIVTIDLENTKQDFFSSCLLTPQGKLFHHFFLFKQKDGFLLDVHHKSSESLKEKIGFYKLMSNINIEDRPDLEVISTTEQIFPDMRLDPRNNNLGWRGIRKKTGEITNNLNLYETKKISLCIVEDGEDIAPSEYFPMELNYDILNTISFNKGCFIGQEVTSRMYRKGRIKKRIFPFKHEEQDIKKGEIHFENKKIGQIIKVTQDNGIALLRTDSFKSIKDHSNKVLVNGEESTLIFSIPDGLNINVQ